MGEERPDWGHATELEDVSGRAAIAGIGETAYTKASGRTAREIGIEAAERAIADAGLEPADIDGLTWSGAFADFDVDVFVSISAPRTTCGRRRGAAGWRGPRPRRTSPRRR